MIVTTNCNIKTLHDYSTKHHYTTQTKRNAQFSKLIFNL